MTSLLLALALAPAFPDAGGTSAVDMFWDGEGSGTVTRGQLTKQTHAVSSVGPWTITDGDSDPDITFNASGQLADLKSPVSVKGTTYTGSGSTGFQLNIGSDPTSECRYPVANASWIFAGFFFKVNTETDFANCDLLELRGSTGKNFLVFQWRSNEQKYLNAHSERGEGNQLTNGITNDVLYWGQMLYEQNLKGVIAAWRVSDWTYLGASTNTFTGSTPVNLIVAPQFGTHGKTSPTLPNQYFDNFIFKWSGTKPDPTKLFPP